MQNLGRYYVRYVNQIYQRSGTLWEGRFKSTLVDTESYL
jgi:putative transposase